MGLNDMVQDNHSNMVLCEYACKVDICFSMIVILVNVKMTRSCCFEHFELCQMNP